MERYFETAYRQLTKSKSWKQHWHWTTTEERVIQEEGLYSSLLLVER